MLERGELDYVIDVTVSKEEYFCRMEIKETCEIREFSGKGTVASFAQAICRNLFIWHYLYRGRFGMEEKFARERIRTCIREKCEWEFFYLPGETLEPVSVGIFITWEDENDEN